MKKKPAVKCIYIFLNRTLYTNVFTLYKTSLSAHESFTEIYLLALTDTCGEFSCFRPLWCLRILPSYNNIHNNDASVYTFVYNDDNIINWSRTFEFGFAKHVSILRVRELLWNNKTQLTPFHSINVGVCLRQYVWEYRFPLPYFLF